MDYAKLGLDKEDTENLPKVVECLACALFMAQHHRLVNFSDGPSTIAEISTGLHAVVAAFLLKAAEFK